jgi:hypothetical protein
MGEERAMTEKQYHSEMIQRMFEKKGRMCLCCGEKPATQAAHRIPQRKGELAEYGWRVVHHWQNLEPVCSLDCNAKMQIARHEWRNAAAFIMHDIGQGLIQQEVCSRLGRDK